MKPDARPNMLAAALQYAARGIPVFPCKPDKKPLVDHGFHEATTDAEQIKKWWTDWPNAMIGMPTGEKSGIDVLDLDLDEAKGKDGFSQIPDWNARSPIIVRTPRGGAHLWFKSDGSIRNSTNKLGVDTRGNGGYVILPPSQNGTASYRFEQGSEQELANLPPFPADLQAKLLVKDTPRTPGDEPQADPALVAAALAVIPNADLGWEDWNRIGMATWRATGGNADGLTAFDAWSQKSQKYEAGTTAKKWAQYFTSQPTKIGAGTLFYLANEAAPGWDGAYYAALGEHLNDADPEALAEIKAELEAAKSRPEQNTNPKSEETKSAKTKSEETKSEETKSEEPKSEQPKAKSDAGLSIVRVFDVKAKKVDWLWNQRIARGKLTIIAGMPDVNKSTLGLYLAALITTGGDLPANEGRVPLGSVIILTAEDDVADTVRPRLEVAGADLTRVHIVTATKATKGKELLPFDLYLDIARLEIAVREIGDVMMVIVDPISAYMGKPGKLDTYRNADVRATLAPLQEMAARCSVAVVAIDHLNKSGGAQAMMRVLGSIAFVAAARAVYVVVRDEEEDDKRLFLPAKNNLGKIRTGLAFRIVEKFATTVFDAYPAIKWEDEIVTMTADEALGQKADGRKSEKVEAAKKLISEMLAHGAVPQKDIEQHALDQEIGHKSLRNAKTALGVVSTQAGGRWWWSLPGQKEPL